MQSMDIVQPAVFYFVMMGNFRLLQQVLRRFEKETDRVLLISTLCLLEASRFGLLEFELLEILKDREDLEYRESNKGLS